MDNAVAQIYSLERRKEERRRIERREGIINLREAFHNIHLAIHSTLDFNQVMNKIAVEPAKAIGCESAIIALREDKLWIMRYFYGFHQEPLTKSFTDEELPHAALVEMSRKAVGVNDTFNDDGANREVMRALGIRAVLALPLTVRGKVIGTLFLNYHSAIVTFSDTMIDFANKVGMSASEALENARLYEDLMHQRNEIRIEKELSEALNNINMIIHSTYDTDVIMKRVIGEAARAIGAETAMTLLIEEGQWEVRHVYKLPPELAGKRFTSAEVKHAALAVEMSAPVAVDNVLGDRRVNREFVDSLGIRSLIVSPLITRGEAIGGFVFHYHSMPTGLDRAHINFAGSLADSMSLAFNNVYSYNAVINAQNHEGLLTNAMLDVIETFAQPFVIMNSDGRLVFYNRAFVDLTGYSAEEFKSITWLSDITPPECHAAEEKVFGQLKRTGEPQVYQSECMRKDGKRLPIDLIAHRTLDKKGNAVYYYAFITDISERKRAENELRQAQNDLRDHITELEQHNKEFEIINNMNGLLQACNSIEEMYRIIAKYVSQLFASDRGAVYIIDEAETMLQTIATWGDIIIEEQILTPRDCWAMRLGKTYFADSTDETLCAHIIPVTGTTYTCIPMTAKSEDIGLFHLQFKKSAEGPQEKEERLAAHKKHLAAITAESISLSLVNFKLRESFFLQSILDPLTELYNRRYMLETFEKELHRMIRKRTPLGVIMLDIDYFKQFNDTYGHEAGDVLLRELSAFIRKCIRQEDIACRYGGEEFVIILPESSLDASRNRAEQLRQEIKQLSFPYLGKILGPITLSFGVAALPQHGATQEDILRAADAALYKAKAEGRDRVVIAGDTS